MPTEVHIAAFGREAQIVSSINIGEMWDRNLSAFLNEWMRLNRQQVSGTEMESAMLNFMEGLSEAPVADAARKSAGVAYSQGRSAEILSKAETGEAEFVVRSEILDQNTCAECLALDGEVFDVGTQDYFRHMPPAFCLGGDRCRGFYVAVPAEQAA